MTAAQAVDASGAATHPGSADGAAAEPVDVVVLHWRNVDKTLRCLRSLAALDYPHVRVIVVDNGSGDGSAQVIAAELRGDGHEVSRLGYEGRDPAGEPVLAPLDGPPATIAGWVLVESPINRGYAGGANVGLITSQYLHGATFFWLLNNDLTVAPDALDHLVHRCRRDRRIGLCGVLQLRAKDDGAPTKDVIAAGGFRFLPLVGHFWQVRSQADSPEAAETEVERAMFGVQGAAVFGTHQFLASVGLFDEARFLYFEEQDWTERAKKAGYRLGYAPRAMVWHAAGSGFGHASTGRTSVVSRYFMARSRLHFTRQRHPWALPTVCAGQLLHVIWLLCSRRRDEASSALAGMVHGITGRWKQFPQLGAVSYRPASDS